MKESVFTITFCLYHYRLLPFAAEPVARAAITCLCVLPHAAHMLLSGSAEGELRLWTVAPSAERA